MILIRYYGVICNNFLCYHVAEKLKKKPYCHWYLRMNHVFTRSMFVPIFCELTMAELYKEDTVEQRILLSYSAFALYLYKPHNCNHSIHSFSLTHAQTYHPKLSVRITINQTNKQTSIKCYCLHQERSRFPPIFVFFKNLNILSGFKLRIPWFTESVPLISLDGLVNRSVSGPLVGSSIPSLPFAIKKEAAK